MARCPILDAILGVRWVAAIDAEVAIKLLPARPGGWRWCGLRGRRSWRRLWGRGRKRRRRLRCLRGLRWRWYWRWCRRGGPCNLEVEARDESLWRASWRAGILDPPHLGFLEGLCLPSDVVGIMARLPIL